jgi:hypothetical protein
LQSFAAHMFILFVVIPEAKDLNSLAAYHLRLP